MAPQPIKAHDNDSFDPDEQHGIMSSYARTHRESSASGLSRASFVTARNNLDDISDATSYYYNEFAPEQGYTQAATDGLRRLSLSLLRNRQLSRVSNLETGLSTIAEKQSERVLPGELLPPPPASPTNFADPVSPATTVADEQVSRRLQIFLLTVLCTTNLCLAMCYSLIAPFFPSEMLRKGGTATLGGIVMSSYDFIRTFLAPVFGLHIYAIGPRFMLVTGPFVGACCTVLFGLLERCPGVVMFTILAIIIRMLNGIGAVAYFVVSTAIRPILFARYLSFAFGIIQASWTTGIVIGPAVGSVLYSFGGYGLPFFVLGALALSLSAIQFFAVPDLNKLEEAAANAKRENEAKLKLQRTLTPLATNATDIPVFRKPTFLAFCRNPSIMFTFVTYASFAFGLTFYSANLALHIRPLLGENPDSKAGYIILIAGVTEVIIAPFAGLSLDYGVPPTLAIVAGFVCNFVGLSLIGPSPILAFLSRKLWLVMVGSAIFGCGIGFSMSAPYKLATRNVLEAGFPANQQTFGLLAGCFASSYTGGSFLGPIVGGALHDVVGFPWASTIVCGYLVFMMTLVILVSTWKRLQARFSEAPKKIDNA